MLEGNSSSTQMKRKNLFEDSLGNSMLEENNSMNSSTPPIYANSQKKLKSFLSKIIPPENEEFQDVNYSNKSKNALNRSPSKKKSNLEKESSFNLKANEDEFDDDSLSSQMSEFAIDDENIFSTQLETTSQFNPLNSQSLPQIPLNSPNSSKSQKSKLKENPEKEKAFFPHSSTEKVGISRSNNDHTSNEDSINDVLFNKDFVNKFFVSQMMVHRLEKDLSNLDRNQLIQLFKRIKFAQKEAILFQQRSYQQKIEELKIQLENSQLEKQHIELKYEELQDLQKTNSSSFLKPSNFPPSFAGNALLFPKETQNKQDEINVGYKSQKETQSVLPQLKENRSSHESPVKDKTTLLKLPQNEQISNLEKTLASIVNSSSSHSSLESSSEGNFVKFYQTLIENLEGTVEKLRNEKSEIEKNKQGISSQLGEICIKIEQIKTEIQSKDLEIIQLKQNHQSSLIHLEKSHIENKILSSTISSFEQKIKQQEIEIRKLLSQSAHSSQQLESKTKENESLKNENHFLIQQLEENKTKQNKLQKSDHSSLLENHKKQLESFQEENDSLKHQLKVIKQEKEDLLHNNSLSSQKLKIEYKKYSSLKEEYQKLETLFNKEKEILENICLSNQQYLRLLNILKLKNKQLKQQQSPQNTNSSFSTTSDSTSLPKKTLGKSLSSLEQEHPSNNSNSPSSLHLPNFDSSPNKEQNESNGFPPLNSDSSHQKLTSPRKQVQVEEDNLTNQLLLYLQQSTEKGEKIFEKLHLSEEKMTLLQKKIEEYEEILNRYKLLLQKVKQKYSQKINLLNDQFLAKENDFHLKLENQNKNYLILEKAYQSLQSDFEFQVFSKKGDFNESPQKKNPKKTPNPQKHQKKPLSQLQKPHSFDSLLQKENNQNLIFLPNTKISLPIQQEPNNPLNKTLQSNLETPSNASNTLHDDPHSLIVATTSISTQNNLNNPQSKQNQSDLQNEKRSSNHDLNQLSNQILSPTNNPNQNKENLNTEQPQLQQNQNLSNKSQESQSKNNEALENRLENEDQQEKRGEEEQHNSTENKESLQDGNQENQEYNQEEGNQDYNQEGLQENQEFNQEVDQDYNEQENQGEGNGEENQGGGYGGEDYTEERNQYDPQNQNIHQQYGEYEGSEYQQEIQATEYEGETYFDQNNQGEGEYEEENKEKMEEEEGGENEGMGEYEQNNEFNEDLFQGEAENIEEQEFPQQNLQEIHQQILDPTTSHQTETGEKETLPTESIHSKDLGFQFFFFQKFFFILSFFPKQNGRTKEKVIKNTLPTKKVEPPKKITFMRPSLLFPKVPKQNKRASILTEPAKPREKRRLSSPFRILRKRR